VCVSVCVCVCVLVRVCVSVSVLVFFLCLVCLQHAPLQSVILHALPDHLHTVFFI